LSDLRPSGRNIPPFYCPYCGDDQIRPAGERDGEWACELCRRAWRLHYLGGAGSGAAAGSGVAAEAQR